MSLFTPWKPTPLFIYTLGPKKGMGQSEEITWTYLTFIFDLGGHVTVANVNTSCPQQMVGWVQPLLEWLPWQQTPFKTLLGGQ